MTWLRPRLHATTWWALAILAAGIATVNDSPVYLGACIALSLAAMKLFRDQTLRSQSIGFYVLLAIAVVFIRVVFRILFNQPDAFQETAIDLPRITIANAFSILGPISQVSLHSAIIDGLRLAAIILAIGMANTVANPRKLLRSTPGALYEVATAAAVAINLAPQLVESLHRVRKARSLRSDARGLKTLKTIIIPVLEDALDRSLSLAASMDARGFGRREIVTKTQAATSRSTSIAAILLLSFGAYAMLLTDQLWLAITLLTAGLVLLFASIKLQSKRQLRTFYRAEKPTWRDMVTLIVATAVLLLIASLR